MLRAVCTLSLLALVPACAGLFPSWNFKEARIGRAKGKNPLISHEPLSYSRERASANHCLQGSTDETYTISLRPGQVCLSIAAVIARPRGEQPWYLNDPYFIEVDGRRVGPVVPAQHGETRLVNECDPIPPDQIPNSIWRQPREVCTEDSQLFTANSKKVTLSLVGMAANGEMAGDPVVIWTLP